MCGGVYYLIDGQEVRTYFPTPKACLPVRKKGGGVELLPWGRRKSQAGRLPLGGWARLDSIYAGRWDKWFPVPVKICVQRFMEQDVEGRTRWFELPKGKWIQGLVAHERHEQRVYVVVVEPQLSDALYERWPRIFCA